MVRQHGEATAVVIMALAIHDLLQDLNLQNTMSPAQIDRASELLVRKFNNLNPADVKLCFDKMRLGEYGEYYNRMDVQILAKCLNEYFAERIEIAQHASDRVHDDSKKDIVIPDNTISLEEFREKRKELFDKLGWDDQEKQAKSESEYQKFRVEYHNKEVVKQNRIDRKKKKAGAKSDSVDGGKG